MMMISAIAYPRGGAPYNVLYGEAPPEGVPFSGFHKLRYIKG